MKALATANSDTSDLTLVTWPQASVTVFLLRRRDEYKRGIQHEHVAIDSDSEELLSIQTGK